MRIGDVVVFMDGEAELPAFVTKVLNEERYVNVVAFRSDGSVVVGTSVRPAVARPWPSYTWHHPQEDRRKAEGDDTGGIVSRPLTL